MATVVRDDPGRSRYELWIDDRLVGVADYRIDGDRVVFPHTAIDREHRGRGLADVLVEAMLRDLARPGRTLVPACWYVAGYLQRHPEVPGAPGPA